MKVFKLPLQKNYPRKVYFADECYKIVFKKNLECYGITDPEKKTITIKDGLSPRALLATWVHEMIHLMEMEQPIKISHKDVYKWERAVVELLIDNFL